MIIPAVLGPNFTEVQRQMRLLEGHTDWLHLDVTDGRFTGVRSWSTPDDLKFLDGKTKIELHLMTKQPEEMLRDWADVVDRIIVHPEATDHLEEILSFLETSPTQAGVALLLNTEAEDIEPYLDRIDVVQFMSIAEVGKQGYAFDESAVEKIKLWRAKHPGVTISVDGGINLDTAKFVLAAGANNLVVGSAIWKTEDPIATLNAFTRLQK